MEKQCALVTGGIYLGSSTGYRDPRAEELAKGTCDWRLLLQVDSADDAEEEEAAEEAAEGETGGETGGEMQESGAGGDGGSADGDDGVEFEWGDDGRLFFWIREQDLAARNFGAAWHILQCY